jgi:hypothetical protein
MVYLYFLLHIASISSHIALTMTSPHKPESEARLTTCSDLQDKGGTGFTMWGAVYLNKKIIIILKISCIQLGMDFIRQNKILIPQHKYSYTSAHIASSGKDTSA